MSLLPHRCNCPNCGNRKPLIDPANLLAAAKERIAELERERDAYKKTARDFEESIDNVREALGLESTHYLVIHNQVADALAAARAEGREAKDAAYDERNQVVALLARIALAMGWRAGIGIHQDKPGEKWEPDWRTLLCIDLPTGQASWHFHDSQRHLLDGLPPYATGWDGHDTPEKYRRVRAALASGDTSEETT